eukprot:3700169-Lingulodinium_polyedra.AAC.1
MITAPYPEWRRNHYNKQQRLVGPLALTGRGDNTGTPRGPKPSSHLRWLRDRGGNQPLASHACC